ncbi:putative gustatory receptor 22d [Drosophila obscura]|uniref:putative gustatory receptor 22d n=1 Tax=Drosophila obscura TaxID=7282 RepID=UPI001BB18114|nr:putative gustatory receptor 22d [Drosophila obscura]
MHLNKSRFYSWLSKFLVLNGLHTFYFSFKLQRLVDSRMLRAYNLIHHFLCVMAVVRMLYISHENPRVCISTLTMCGTTACNIVTCWQGRHLRKVFKQLLHLDKKYFKGQPSGYPLNIRYYMKMLLVVITLTRIHIFYPIYMKSVFSSLFVLNVVSYWLLYNMLLAAVLEFYSVLWQMCRNYKLINDQMSQLLARSRQRNRAVKMRRWLHLYSKMLRITQQVCRQYENCAIFVLACKSWFQITFGYEIFVMLAAPKSLDLSLSMRIFVILSYLLDAFNLYFGTDIAEHFTQLREDSLRIMRETTRMDRLLSVFTLELSLHPKRIEFLNVFAFDRKLTLTVMAKSMLYTICWLQADYMTLKR